MTDTKQLTDKDVLAEYNFPADDMYVAGRFPNRYTLLAQVKELSEDERKTLSAEVCAKLAYDRAVKIDTDEEDERRRTNHPGVDGGCWGLNENFWKPRWQTAIMIKKEYEEAKAADEAKAAAEAKTTKKE